MSPPNSGWNAGGRRVSTAAHYPTSRLEVDLMTDGEDAIAARFPPRHPITDSVEDVDGEQESDCGVVDDVIADLVQLGKTLVPVEQGELLFDQSVQRRRVVV